MKECTNCNKVRDDFSNQKTNPHKLYAWCDECRKTNVKSGMRYNNGYAKEVSELKNKAIQLRAFTPEQATELKSRYLNGTKVAELAKETGKSDNAVRKAIRGYK